MKVVLFGLAVLLAAWWVPGLVAAIGPLRKPRRLWRRHRGGRR